MYTIAYLIPILYYIQYSSILITILYGSVTPTTVYGFTGGRVAAGVFCFLLYMPFWKIHVAYQQQKRAPADACKAVNSCWGYQFIYKCY